MSRFVTLALTGLLLPFASPALAAATPPVQLAAARGETPRQDPQTLAARQARGENLLFVDVRTKSEFAEQHIYGAASVPITQLERGSWGLPKDRTLVLYCTCPDEHASLAAGRMLLRRGYTRLVALQGGMDAWEAAGYKIVTKAPPATPRPTLTPSPRPPKPPTPKPSETPVAPSATPQTAPDQLAPMDERRGTSQTP